MVTDIYFVRHGETVHNKKSIHQKYDEPLSDRGREQGERVAEYLSKLAIDTVLTSPFTRTRETAEYISRQLGIPMTIVTPVHEVIRPSFLYGKSHYSWATLKYVALLFWYRAQNSWDNDDAENMFDVRNRIIDTKELLHAETGKSIVVVSHAIFIDLFIHLVCAEKPLTFWQFLHFIIFIKKIPNTTVVHLQFDDQAPSGICPWQLASVTTPDNFV